MPNGDGTYYERLVRTVSVVFYQQRFGAVLPVEGQCPVCTPLSVEAVCTSAGPWFKAR